MIPGHSPLWMLRGACRGVDPNIFHPEKSESADPAREVCARCRVIDLCLDFAVTTNQPQGVWGGMSVQERKAERRRRRLGPDITDVPVETTLPFGDVVTPPTSHPGGRRFDGVRYADRALDEAE